MNSMLALPASFSLFMTTFIQRLAAGIVLSALLLPSVTLAAQTTQMTPAYRASLEQLLSLLEQELAAILSLGDYYYTNHRTCCYSYRINREHDHFGEFHSSNTRSVHTRRHYVRLHLQYGNGRNSARPPRVHSARDNDSFHKWCRFLWHSCKSQSESKCHVAV